MVVKDHGLEVLKKSGEVVDQSATPDPRENEYIKVGGLRRGVPGDIPAVGVEPKLVGQFFNKLAHNTRVGLAASEDVWDFGGDYPFQTVASTLSIVSDNINDTLLGTGARQLLVEGLDSGFNAISETIDMDGITPVITSNSYLRINEITATSIGSTFKNEGTIDASISATVVARILPLFSRTLMSMFAVPEGKVAKIVDMFGGINHTADAFGEKQGELVFYSRAEGGPFIPQQIMSLSTKGTSTMHVTEFNKWLTFPARTDLKMRFQAFDNNAFVTGSYKFDLEDAV